MNMNEQIRKWDCERLGVTYIPEDGDPEERERMLSSISAEREKENRALQERRDAEEVERDERVQREAAERKLNTGHLTVGELLRNWSRTTPPRFREADIRFIGMGDRGKAILDGASALILGPNGSGKTYTGYALTKAWAEMGHDAMLIKATELLGKVKTATDPFKAARDMFGRSVRHLVIDEVDKIFESKADFVYLNYLIDHRYEWMLQTVALGNGDKDGFIAAMGQSIYSRLTGDGGIGVVLNRADRRKERSNG
jgi:DNA replication protein DnaC